MTFLPIGFLIALGEARSCLAALAGSTEDLDLSAPFCRLLIQLDFITGDAGSTCSPIAGTRAEFLRRLEADVDQMLDLGAADGLGLELMLHAAMNFAGSVKGRSP